VAVTVNVETTWDVVLAAISTVWTVCILDTDVRTDVLLIEWAFLSIVTILTSVEAPPVVKGHIDGTSTKKA